MRRFPEHLLTVKDHFLTGEKFDIYRNPSTGLMATIPQPNLNDIEKYYATEDYLSHNDNGSGAFAKAYKLVKQRNLKARINLIDDYASGGRILDIGAGTGELVKGLLDHKFDASGVEPSPNARKFAKKKNLDLLSSSSDIANNSFDLICMWHVLEHVPDIEEQIFCNVMKLI